MAVALFVALAVTALARAARVQGRQQPGMRVLKLRLRGGAPAPPLLAPPHDSEVRQQMVGDKNGQGADVGSKAKTPDERANGGGARGKRRKTVWAADSTPTTSVKDADRVLNPSSPKKRIPKRCEHQRQKSQCKDCGGSSICKHQRQRSQYKDCGGSSICEHQRQRSTCKACGGGSICEHQRLRSRCKDCREVKSKAAEIRQQKEREQEKGGGEEGSA